MLERRLDADRLAQLWGTLAALERVGDEAFGPGQYIGQQNFMTADRILTLARVGGVGPATRVVDLCSGTGGPARFLARATGCRIVACDVLSEAIYLARRAAFIERLSPRTAWVVADARRPPLTGGFDVALFLETMVSVEDKRGQIQAVAGLLRPGDRFVVTVETGAALTAEESHDFPSDEPIWLIRDDDFAEILTAAGFRVGWRADWTESEAGVTRRLTEAFERDRAALMNSLSAEGADYLIRSHACWAQWFGSGRIRKVVLVAERTGQDTAPSGALRTDC